MKSYLARKGTVSENIGLEGIVEAMWTAQHRSPDLGWFPEDRLEGSEAVPAG